MRVAELAITVGHHFSQAAIMVVGFETIEEARSEFDRLAELLKRREDRANDLPKIIEVKAINQVTCPISDITCVALTDFAHANEHEVGVKDTFPNLFKK